MQMADVWKYLTTEWLTLPEIAADGHRHRWPLSEFWRCVQESTVQFGEITGVSRVDQTRPRFEALAKQLAGLMVSAGALAIGVLPDGDDENQGREVVEAVVRTLLSDPSLDGRMAKRAAQFASMRPHLASVNDTVQ